MTATPCPGVRSPVNPSSRVALCRGCCRFDVLAVGVPPARRSVGNRAWTCDELLPYPTAPAPALFDAAAGPAPAVHTGAVRLVRDLSPG